MERDYRKVTYSVRNGADFPQSVPVIGKDMDQQEPKALSRVPAFVTDTKSNLEAYPQKDALPAVRGVRKRKEYCEVDRSACDTRMYDRKRMRQIGLPARRSKEAVKSRKGVSLKVDTGGGEKRIGGSKHPPSSGFPRATFHMYDGLKESERVLHLDSGVPDTSIASSDDAGDDKKSGGNTSTLTFNEDGDSRLMTFSQVPKGLVETSNRFAKYAVPSKDHSFTGTAREDVTGSRHVSSSDHQTSRWRHPRKSADCEVVSGPPKKTLSFYSGRECELNRVFGVGLWNSQYEKITDERHNARAMDSRYSHEAGSESSRDSRDREPDVRDSKLKQPCVEYGFSNSSREHQSSSVVTDFCASSDSVSISSWLEGRGSVKPYHRFKAGVLTNTSSETEPDDKVNFATPTEKTIRLSSVREEQHTTSRSQYTSSRSEGTHPASIRSEREPMAPTRSVPIGREEQHTTSRSQYTSSRSEGTHPVSIRSEREPMAPTRNVLIGRDDTSSGSGLGGSESSKPEPTFVLSSGRLSKTQEAQLGKRPTTIDDDFDQYFAQLML